MKKIDLSFFDAKCVERMKDEIEESEGNEVFFVARKNQNGRVSDLHPVAWGNEEGVPVIYDEAYKGDYVIHNHPSGQLRPSDNDLAIASYLGNQGIGFLIINNSVTKLYVVVESADVHQKEYLDEEEIASLFEDGGAIANQFQSFEKRPSQVEMLQQICKAFNEDLIALIEAGTGVGKSMAYLIPSILWAVKNKEKVVISTNTINLQEQLIKKDIPFIQKALNLSFKAVLIKGRRNYICLRKLYSSQGDSEQELFELDEQDWIEGVINAVPTLKEGGREELASMVPPNSWDKIASETDTCLKNRCPYYTQCFFFKARKEVNQSQILIVNHHILCSDIAIKKDQESDGAYGLLPPYEKLVVDEAHNLENVALQYMGYTSSQFGFRQTVSRLYRLRGNSEKGVLSFLKRELKVKQEDGDFESINNAYNHLTDIVIPKILNIYPKINDFFQLIFDFALDNIKNQYENTLRILPEKLPEKFKQALKKESTAFIDGIKEIYDDLSYLAELLDEIPFHIREDILGTIKDFNAYQNRLLSSMTSLECFVFFKESDAVYWLEVKKRENFPWVRLNVSPLNVAEMLNDFLFSYKESIALCSATLTIDNKFQYFKSETGLELVPSHRLSQSILESPFNYKEQMSICIPADLPLPQNKNFNEAINEFLIDVLDITAGKTFILFTSYSMLNQTYDFLLDHFGHDLSILKQGAMDRHTLVDRFKNGNETVLLGTDSFWEGVDVPGEALKCVVLVKLPFKVPTEPVTQGKVEKIEREGKNSFLEYTIPQSVIKFRQGFGRLIRTAEDEGIVVCLDKRLITMPYGRLFLNSIPPCNQVIGESDMVFDEIAKYF